MQDPPVLLNFHGLAGFLGAVALIWLPIASTLHGDRYNDHQFCAAVPTLRARLPEAVVWNFLSNQAASTLKLSHPRTEGSKHAESRMSPIWPHFTALLTKFKEFYFHHAHMCIFHQVNAGNHSNGLSDICRGTCSIYFDIPMTVDSDLMDWGSYLLSWARVIIERGFAHFLAVWLVVSVFVLDQGFFPEIEIEYNTEQQGENPAGNGQDASVGSSSDSLSSYSSDSNEDSITQVELSGLVRRCLRLTYLYILIRACFTAFMYWDSLRFLCPGPFPVQVVVGLILCAWLEIVIMTSNWWAVAIILLLLALIGVLLYLGYGCAGFGKSVLDFATTAVKFNCTNVAPLPTTKNFGESDCAICFEPLYINEKIEECPLRISAVECFPNIRIDATRVNSFGQKLLRVNQCRHLFHSRCLNLWLTSIGVSGSGVSQDGCPLCRAPLYSKVNHRFRVARSVHEIIAFVRHAILSALGADQFVPANQTPDLESQSIRLLRVFVGVLRILASSICYLIISALFEKRNNPAEWSFFPDRQITIFLASALLFLEIFCQAQNSWFIPSRWSTTSMIYLVLLSSCLSFSWVVGIFTAFTIFILAGCCLRLLSSWYEPVTAQ